jgi:hypothetical protein
VNLPAFDASRDASFDSWPSPWGEGARGTRAGEGSGWTVGPVSVGSPCGYTLAVRIPTQRGSANCATSRPKLKRRHGSCCAAVGQARNSAGGAASTTGWWISTALNIDSPSSWMVVFICSPARCGRTLLTKEDH